MATNSRLSSTIHLFVVGALTSGCAALSPSPPFHFLETAETLKKGDLAATIGVGGGAIDWGGAGGGALRVRGGVGGGQEVGFEATALYADTGHCDTPTTFNPHPKCDPWIGKSFAFAAKLAYKVAPTRWLAFLFGAGVSQSSVGLTGGGDAGLIVSAPTRWVQPYAATRFTIGAPIDHALHSRGGVTPVVVAAGGLAIPIKRARLYVEGGFVKAWLEQYDSSVNTLAYHDYPGGYLAAGVQLPLN
jgi:hypothetical protein